MKNIHRERQQRSSEKGEREKKAVPGAYPADGNSRGYD
jgi:hypothetical protein